jgi:hypothetical protein
MMKRVYIAGPMSGIPQFNFPAFFAAAEALRAAGYDVVSPAELDDQETVKAALASKDGAPGSGSSNGQTWGDFLARDVKLIADDGIPGVVLLPDWEKSKGAKLEAFVGVLGKLEFATFQPVSDVAKFTLTPRSLGWVMYQISTQYADEIAIHVPLTMASRGGFSAPVVTAEGA